MSDDQRDSEGERSGGEEREAVGPASSPSSSSKREDGEAGQGQAKKETGKPADHENDSRYIKLRVVGNVSNQDSNGINFRLKWTTALLKLKKSYSNHVGIPTGNLRFLFDGRRISDEDTPKQLDMNDDDQIEVYHEQTGGR